MTEQIPYHVGILVPDLDAAIAVFTKTLGYTFNDPVRLPIHQLEDRIAGTDTAPVLAVTYSRTGPLRLELIEFQGSGVYSSDRGEGLHHVGVWEPDPESRLRQLEAAGQQVDAIVWGRDGSISVLYAGPSAASGVRVEYVNEAQRPRLERWFETGVLA